jgi:O-antigen/teichoic acid export membrane protein
MINSNYLWILLGQGSRFLINSIYLILLIRVLKINEYGLVSSTLALMYIFFPLMGFGIGNILIKNIAQNKENINLIWGQSLKVIAFSFIVVCPFSIAVYIYINDFYINIFPFIIFSLTELLLYSLIELCCQLLQSINESKKVSIISMIYSSAKLLSVLILYVISNPELNSWLWLYFFSTFSATLLTFYIVTRTIGYPIFNKSKDILMKIKESSFFSINNLVTVIINEIDKLILNKFTTSSLVGIYTLSYKMIDISFIPIKSFLFYSYANFFKYGKGGIKDTLRYSLPYMSINIVIALLIAITIYLIAPIVPFLVGKSDPRIVNIIKFMCLIPLIRTLYYFTGDILTGSGFQKLRTLINIPITLLSVLLNVYLIKIYSWTGAIITMYISYTLIILVQIILILFLMKYKQNKKLENN